MEIFQFEDKGLAHYSYAILSEGRMALVDPARNPGPYYELAENRGALIVAVIETHPHADFVSSHLEIHRQTGARIYVSRLLGALYPHEPFDEGAEIQLGTARLRALNTPGHSPDSISIVALDEEGRQKAVFTGDTLFIGDCGRPDLRESAGNLTAAREELARQMYHSLRTKLMTLPDEVIVYPAHGAGSLCGKALGSAHSSTIGAEKMSNWSMQPQSEDEFVQELLADQPFVPAYFPYAVEINRRGAEPFRGALAAIEIRDVDAAFLPETGVLIADARPAAQFRRGHLPGAFNLMDDTRFETWLGSVIQPGEAFYLLAADSAVLQTLLQRTASIGYEKQVKAGLIGNAGMQTSPGIDVELFRQHPEQYTIVDLRNPSEVKARRIFDQALEIPLYQLRSRVNEIPGGKPVLVHCAGGYRSAAGASILQSVFKEKTPVFDLGEAVKTF